MNIHGLKQKRQRIVKVLQSLKGRRDKKITIERLEEARNNLTDEIKSRRPKK